MGSVEENAVTRSSKIRFVGGPWHNRVVCVDLLSVYKVPEEMPSLVALVGNRHVPRLERKTHDYVLLEFRQDGADGMRNLVFKQYVHSSLCQDPPRWVSDEVGFPPLPKSYVDRFDRMLARTTLCKLLCGGGRKRLKADED